MAYNPREGIEIEKRFPAGVAGDAGKALVVNAGGDGYEHAVQSGSRQTGEVILWPFPTAPAGGWLKLDGATYNDVDYPSLAILFGNLGTFTLPDMREKFPMGAAVGFPVAGEVEPTVGTHTHEVAANAGTHTHTGVASSAGLHGHGVSVGNGGYHGHTTNAHRVVSGGSTVVSGSGRGLAGSDVSSGGEHSHSASAGSAGTHSHTVTISGGGAHNHSVSPHEGVNRPAGVAFDYYIKT